jgi:hypothetical protein
MRKYQGKPSNDRKKKSKPSENDVSWFLKNMKNVGKVMFYYVRVNINFI